MYRYIRRVSQDIQREMYSKNQTIGSVTSRGCDCTRSLTCMGGMEYVSDLSCLCSSMTRAWHRPLFLFLSNQHGWLYRCMCLKKESWKEDRRHPGRRDRFSVLWVRFVFIMRSVICCEEDEEEVADKELTVDGCFSICFCT